MSIYKNSKQFFLSNDISPTIKKINKRQLINVLSLFFTGLVVVYGVTTSTLEQTFTSLITYIIPILLVATNLVLLNTAKIKKEFASKSFVFLISFFSLIALWLGKITEPDILWYAVFPVAFLTLTPKKGNLIAAIFFIIVTLTLFLPVFSHYSNDFHITYKLLFILAYAGCAYLINVVQQNIDSTIEKQQKELNQLSDELKNKEKFISKVSHQIRTPLNNIVVVSNMIDPSVLNEQHKDYFDTILASANNIVDVVNSFSEISNVDVQKRKQYEITFDLNSTLQNTFNLFSDEDNAEADNYPVMNISSEIHYSLLGDPVKIKQIFLNLIEQILKHSSKNREINIYLKKTGKSNDTTGVIFELHTKGLSSIAKNIKTKSPQSKNEQIIHQLELNIAKKMINSLNGDLEISLSDDTTIFKFELDFKKAEPQTSPEKDQTQVKARKTTSSELNLKDANVLLVEDNLINQKIVLLSLKKSVKNVDVANNGKEALDKFGSVKYDIILMDIQMPVMNGIVTTKKIRNIEKSTNTHTPIIAITANALLGDKEECLAAGTDDYISKPFQIETLLDKMKNLLENNS
ncbi:MAG: response regulator [Bacteroidales bacterium]